MGVCMEPEFLSLPGLWEQQRFSLGVKLLPYFCETGVGVIETFCSIEEPEISRRKGVMNAVLF